MNSTLDLARLYCQFLEEIRARLGLIRAIAARAESPAEQISKNEIVAINLRKILELIAFGSLTANKAAYSATYAGFEKHWKAKLLLESLEKIHPDFYPKPLLPGQPVPDEHRHYHFDYLPSGYLTREEFVELYDLCSNSMHSPNPFAPAKPVGLRLPVAEWASRIEALLSLHLMRLSGTPEIWIVYLQHPEDGRAHAFLAAPQG